MANDSSTGGYLAPEPPGPLYDTALEDFFQQIVVGITGIPGNLVRPRWQQEPPNPPPAKSDWIALGVEVGPKQWDAYQKFDPTIGTDGAYIVEGAERIRLALSFYGPNNERNHTAFDDGLQLSQNREALSAQKISYIEAESPVNLPALLKDRMRLRVDIAFIFSRWVSRTYPVRTIASASVDLYNESYVEHVEVSPPTP